MKNLNKKTILVVGSLLVIGFIAIMYDAIFWMNHSTLKGRVVSSPNSTDPDIASLENYPLSLWLTVTAKGIPAELSSTGTKVECRVISMDTSENNPGIDGYAVVDNCERK